MGRRALLEKALGLKSFKNLDVDFVDNERPVNAEHVPIYSMNLGTPRADITSLGI
jgi:hypothetical protein